MAPGSAVALSERAVSATPADEVLPSLVTPSRQAERANVPSHRGSRRREAPGVHHESAILNARFITFGAIGAGVFVMGLGLQILLVRDWHFSALASYVVQGIVSVQASFLLNRFWTWRDVDVSFLSALVKFNAQKIATTIANTIIYEALIGAHLNYVTANIATTAIFTVVNYLVADNWVFARPGVVTDDAGPVASVLVEWTATCPPVSVVVPCKNNERTIVATVTSLLGQDYPGLESVILVGSPGDSTWQALTDIHDPRLVTLEQVPVIGRRDPNVKRHKGIQSSRSDIIALADSDIVMEPDWLSKGVSLLMTQGTQCVAGGMQSIHSTFWGRFVDRTRMGAKTPRVSNSYIVTRRNFGKHGRKPPITANVILTRRLYEQCPLDVNWSYGYEDYEWFWRMARAGHRILFSHELAGLHHHRRGLIPLCREYLRASEGCARFIRRHPDCPLAVKRLRQAFLLPLGAILAVGVCVVGFGMGGGSLIGSGLAICAVAAAMWEYLGRRASESLIYPLLNVLLGALFVVGLLKGLSQRDQPPAMSQALADGTPAFEEAYALATRVASPRGPDRGVAVASGRVPPPPLPSQQWPQGQTERDQKTPFPLRYVALFAVILAGGTALRLFELSSRPGWQPDETVYTSIGGHILATGLLQDHLQRGLPWAPFLFHPPFYFLLLANWFRLVGTGITQARELAVVATVVMLCLLFRLIWRLRGPGAACLTLGLVTFDGWLLFVERISYIENTLVIIIVAGLVLYERALRRQSVGAFISAGLVLGFAAVFKQTGVYVLPVVAFHWLVIRRQGRNHLYLAAAVVAVIGAYIGGMIWLFDFGKQQWFLQQSLLQFDRVLGVRQSRGTLNSPLALFHLLSHQYGIFLPSLLVAIAAIVLLVRRGVQCVRARSWEPVRANSLLFCWSTGGVVVFGVSQLHFPQYFVLILLPLYCYLWTEVYAYVRAVPRKLKLAAVALVVVGALGIGSFYLRVLTHRDNTLWQIQQYAVAHIPANDTVITEQDIADVIRQPWCSVARAGACEISATYVITYATYLQPVAPPDDAVFWKIMRGATKVKVFVGFKETITVWRLR